MGLNRNHPVDVDPMNAVEILTITRPSTLFPDLSRAEANWRHLIKKWHPDQNSDPLARQVSAHINALYADVKRAVKSGGYPDTLTIQTKSGPVSFPHLAVRPFELGELYVCERHIIWAAARQHDDLAKRWLDTTGAFRFPNAAEEARNSPFLPKNNHVVVDADRTFTIIDRTADYIRVSDIVAKMGPLDPKHAAWVMSRAYNLACFLGYAGIVHLDIRPETFFIEPSSHIGALLGGWFYTGYERHAPLAVPSRAEHLARQRPALAHLSQIRAMGRRLVGAPTVADLRQNTTLPAPLKAWLLGWAGSDPIAETAAWGQIIDKSFGPRRFTPYPLTTAEIYSS